MSNGAGLFSRIRQEGSVRDWIESVLWRRGDKFLCVRQARVAFCGRPCPEIADRECTIRKCKSNPQRHTHRSLSSQRRRKRTSVKKNLSEEAGQYENMISPDGAGEGTAES